MSQATRSRRSRRTRQERRAAPSEPIWLPTDEVTAYEFNPRDNAEAIDSVANSLEEFGWQQPIVVDNNNVIVAGHTRHAAAKKLGDEEVWCVRADWLNDEQIRAFRVVDNKLAELASWDQTLLTQEMQALMNLVDFTDYGWTQEAIDCLGEVVADDCLSGGVVDETVRGDAPTRTNQGAGPRTTRVIIGEFVMYLDIGTYSSWAAQLKEDNGFVQEEILADLKRRLGVHAYEVDD